MLNAKDDWLDTAEDIHDFVNFYKTQIASQSGIAQIMFLQGQGGDAMDAAVALVEVAQAKLVEPPRAASGDDLAKPLLTGQPAAKTILVVKAAEVNSKNYLETEADVETYVNALKAELLAAVRAGHKARVQ